MESGKETVQAEAAVPEHASSKEDLRSTLADLEKRAARRNELNGELGEHLEGDEVYFKLLGEMRRMLQKAEEKYEEGDVRERILGSFAELYKRFQALDRSRKGDEFRELDKNATDDQIKIERVRKEVERLEKIAAENGTARDSGRP